MTRPGRLIVVAGTGTDVGKTWVACALIDELRGRALQVAARKPAQSYATTDPTTDAAELATATGERVEFVCPPHRWYARPMAPFMAADALGLPTFAVADLVTETRWPAEADVGIVEAAGGVRSPIAHDGGDTVDLAGALEADVVVLVADAGLGTINAVRLCLVALDSFNVAVFLNRYDGGDDLHQRNHAWLTSHCGQPVITDLATLADWALGPR